MATKKYAVYGTATITIKKIIEVDSTEKLDENDIIGRAREEFGGLEEFVNGTVGSYDDDVDIFADSEVEFESCEEYEEEDDY